MMPMFFQLLLPLLGSILGGGGAAAGIGGALGGAAAGAGAAGAAAGGLGAAASALGSAASLPGAVAGAAGDAVGGGLANAIGGQAGQAVGDLASSAIETAYNNPNMGSTMAPQAMAPIQTSQPMQQQRAPQNMSMFNTIQTDPTNNQQPRKWWEY